MYRQVLVYCPTCDEPWTVTIEDKKVDIEEGSYLVCSNCTHAEPKNQNGSIRLRTVGSSNMDLYPGDS